MASCYPGFSGPCPYCDADDPEFGCWACEDLGWMEHPDEGIIPCTECSQPVEFENIEEFRGWMQ